MNLETRLRSLERKVARMHEASTASRREAMSDDLIISCIQSGDFDTRHLDAAYRILKHGVLGTVLAGAYDIRQLWLTEMDRNHYWGGSGFSWAQWVIAAGHDIEPPSHLNVHKKAGFLTFPLGNEGPRKNEGVSGRAHRGQYGLSRRVILERGIDPLIEVVTSMTGTSPEGAESIFVETVPSVDQEQWERMLKLFKPFQSIWDEELIAPIRQDDL